MSLHKGSEKFKEQWDHFFETVKKPCRCLFCQGRRIYWNGHRERSASVLEGDRVSYFTDILCRRVKCANPACKKSWTLRPPGLMPRRHYQLCVVARATTQFLFQPHRTLTSVASAHQCCRRTVGRWLHWIAGIAKPSALIRRLCAVLAREAFATGDNSQVGGTTRKVFQRTARVFCLLEALGTAYGYPYPAFRGLIEAAINNRDCITTYRFPAIPELAR
ncbi:MAG: hypothetical protein ABIE47_00850 [Pseudomonadota bacterium]